MTMIELGIEAAVGARAGDGHAAGIHDDHIITHLHAGREGRFMLAKQHVGDPGSQAAQVLAAGIHS